MKLSSTLLLCLTAVVLFSCGGEQSSSSSNSTKNPFGDIPNIFAKLQAETPSLRDMKPKDITRELTQKIVEQTEEAVKIVGNKVPFSGDPFKLLEVTEVFIGDANLSANVCNVNIKVLCKPKKEIILTGSPKVNSYDKFTCDGESEADATCSLYAMQYALFVDNSGNIIDYKKFRPFVSGRYDFQYAVGSKITPSKYCNDLGSDLSVQIPNQNFVDFKEIRFVTENELQNIISNTK